MYANVIIDITNEKLDKVFQYQVPDELEETLAVGSEVKVPFGSGNRQATGYIISFSEQPDYDPDKIKPIAGVVKDSLAIESKLVELAAWMKEHYGGTMIQALRMVLPIKRKTRAKETRQVCLLLSEAEAGEKLEEYRHKKQTARARVLEGLMEEPVQAYSLILDKLHVPRKVLVDMEQQGVLEIRSEQLYRNPVKPAGEAKKEFAYTKEQQAAIDTFWNEYQAGERKTYLLQGVTGSGKTEVYMEMISRVIALGKQAIVLIPEIALTYQTVLRFYGRFGDRVTILNSRMSAGERSDQMERVKKGEVDVMIGPRSALFTPFSNLGLIIIDEEQESTYKSEQVPRYHARETAIKRAELEDASVILGSATPSLEASYRCRKGEYERLLLPERVTGQELADVYTVDMREELKNGNRSMLSGRLKELIRDRLERGQQTMLFINRRGYAGFVSCRSCGYVVKCPHCDVSLSYHKGGRLVCHYCGYEEQMQKVCPVCGSGYLGGFKAGTQQIEDLVKQEFPTARVLRMDLDTTRKKDSHEEILSRFANGEADILIGTQMIVKGHDFPNVTLVGILAADLSLYSDDYRAGERTFQLLTQAAGRAGRGREKGEVVIQTYSPQHYAVVMAARQDYEGFYEEEMSYRSLMGYPPVEQLLAVMMTGEDEALLETAAGYVKKFIERADRQHYLQVIGPASPYVGRVNDVYRRVVYVKSEEEEHLIRIKDQLEQYIEINKGFEKLRVQFDFNPMNVF